MNEEIFDALWAIFIISLTIGGSLFSILKKAKNTGKPAASSPGGQVTPHTGKTEMREKEQPKAKARPTTSRKKQTQRSVLQVSPSATREITAEMTTEVRTSHDIATEFDLRRAVIYSEIMRPKFEE